jgi:DNA-binding NarL/FixJ family response regulator
LDEAAWEKAFMEGRTMGMEEAVKYALSKDEETHPLASPAPEEPSAGQAPVALTRREREVATLVSRGLTNRQIAQELYLSERTIENHSSKILRKLELASRTEISAWATEQRLITPNPDEEVPRSSSAPGSPFASAKGFHPNRENRWNHLRFQASG